MSSSVATDPASQSSRGATDRRTAQTFPTNNNAVSTVRALCAKIFIRYQGLVSKLHHKRINGAKLKEGFSPGFSFVFF